MTYVNKTKISIDDSPSADSFGRLRTSTIHTQYDGMNQYDTAPLFHYTTLTGSGTSTHLPNESSVSLNVTNASGDKVVRQTKEYFRYIPGKSLMILMTRVFAAATANLRQRVGYYDDNNGVFFEVLSTGIGVVQRSFTSGSVVDTRVAQASWNLDKLDGTGASGITLDITKNNIYVIDLEWLSAGRVRMGIFSPTTGQPVYCHQFTNSNSISTPYMTTANLPLRSTIENTGATSGSNSLKSTCSTVITEDGNDVQSTIPMSISNGTTSIAVTTRRAILTVRPKATFNSIVNRAKLLDFKYDIYADANAYYEIVYNGTLGGSPSFNSVSASSTVEYDVAGTTVTGGIVVDSGFVGVGSKGSTALGNDLLSKLPVVLDQAGANPINLSIVITSFTGTANSAGSFTWSEIY